MYLSQVSNTTDRSANKEGQNSRQMPTKLYWISKRIAKFLEILAMAVAFAFIVGLLCIPIILNYTQVCEFACDKTI